MENKKTGVLKHKKDIILYCVLFFTMLILNRAQIVGIKILFAAAFAFSMVLLNKNVFIISLSFFISYIVFNISFSGLIIALNVVSALILLFLIFKISNRKMNFTATLLFCLLGQVGYVYFHLNSPAEIIVTTVTIAISLMFLYITNQTFNAIFNRGFQSRFTLDENICLALFLIVFFAGLSNIYVFSINVTNMVVFLLILFAGRTLTKTTTVYLASLMGFGVAFSTGSVTNIAIYVTYAILGTTFKENHKLLSPIAIILADIIFGLFLNTYAYYTYLNLISYVFIMLIYLLIPVKVLEKIKGYTFSYEGSLAEEYIVVGQKYLLKDKLVQLSNLFKQMQSAYRNLSIGEVDRTYVSEVLGNELIDKHCKSCPNYFNCLEKEEIKKAIIQLFEFGLEKGKVTIIDANNLLTSQCRKLTGLISEVNNGLENFFAYEKSIKTADESKVIVAEQFGGTGEILNELSGFVIGGERINYKATKKVLDELTLNNIVVNEALVLETETGVEKIVLIVKNSDALSSNIAWCLKSLFRINFFMEVCSMTKYAGWSVLCFVPAPKYETNVGFACSSKTPNNVSGDNYSFIKLNNNKIMFALSDGMGHGKRANEISTVALNLIESFYKSGFSSNTIISSVNKILLPAGDDSFTTLDACVFDKSNGTADFIKIGASCSVIKSQNTSRLLVQESLPLGIMDKIKFDAKKYVLQDQDIIIMASDGVVDAFDDLEEYVNYINNERIINVQMLANSILEEAESRSQEHNDDKTVIAVKVNVKV